MSAFEKSAFYYKQEKLEFALVQLPQRLASNGWNWHIVDEALHTVEIPHALQTETASKLHEYIMELWPF